MCEEVTWGKQEPWTINLNGTEDENTTAPTIQVWIHPEAAGRQNKSWKTLQRRIIRHSE